MSNHKKIDWFRWHQRKMWIRINCAILSAILLIVLLLMFPIVSDADNPKISDYFFIKEILNLSDAISHNGESGYYTVNSNLFNEPTFLSDSSSDYYDELESLWDCDFPSGFGSNYNMTVYVSTNNEVKVILDGASIHLNFDSNYNYLTPPVVYGGSPCTFTLSNGSLINQTWLEGGSYKNINDCNFILYSTAPIVIYPSINLNYLLIENKVGHGQGGFDIEPPAPTVYPDGSGGTDSNNLYMRTADWKFNIPQYWPSVNSTLVQPAYVNRWGEGSISFYGLLNDYQKANASNFNLKFNFQIVCNGHYFSDTQSSVNGTFVGSFHYDNFIVPLSTFISNNNYATFSVSNLFSNATNGLNQTFASYLDNIKGHNSIDNWQWYIICDACLVSNGSESGHCKEKYDFISQVSKETDYSITDNSDPFYPDDYDPTNQPDDSKEDENAKIINNNNDIININNNDKAVIDKLYDKLVPPDTVGEGGLTERFVNLTNANKWFEIMESQLTIFPAEFWTTIYTIFLASLGILGGAFLLWILAHIL